ncbi:nectin-3-like isoform X2 [Lethenteron reissneri]|uniref:nectin-3-like isoform X2 n=1 Tax=Lethenteron reissneri TaxID=7753 RepID=UPI002AB7EAC1|nr:nectin-3-like isoform X2 [Lethenteron reissneri]
MDFWKLQIPTALLFGLMTLGAAQVEVDRFVSSNTGQEVTLRCAYMGSERLSRITWQKVNGGSPVTIAAAIPAGYAVGFDPDLSRRLRFTNLDSELRNASIRIEDLRLEDAADFVCNFGTLDNGGYSSAKVRLSVNVPPNASLESNPSQLVEGRAEVTVATCVALGGQPAASVTWSGLDHHQGSSYETTEMEPDGTVTVRSEYRMEPTRESHGRTLTCKVEHPALEIPVVKSTILDVHYKPRVTVVEYDGDRDLGRRGTRLTCRVDANPHATHYLWSRDGASISSGALEKGSSLSFRSPLVESGSASFSCRVNNSVGWGEAAIKVMIRSRRGASFSMSRSISTTSAAFTTAISSTGSALTSTSPTASSDSTTSRSTITPASTTTSRTTRPALTTVSPYIGGVETWVVAVAIVVPLTALVAAVGPVYYFCFHKRKSKGENCQQNTADETEQQQHQQQDDHHQYEYIDGKFPSHNLELQQPPSGRAEFYNVHAEITSKWNHRKNLDEKNLNSTESNPQNQYGVHYQPLKPSTGKTYDELNHPTYENV